MVITSGEAGLFHESCGAVFPGPSKRGSGRKYALSRLGRSGQMAEFSSTVIALTMPP